MSYVPTGTKLDHAKWYKTGGKDCLALVSNKFQVLIYSRLSCFVEQKHPKNLVILVNFVESKVNVIMTYPILLNLCIIMAKLVSYLH